jgi:flagellar biosynthetic protein FliR
LFSSNFHHLLLNVLAKSYASFPLGSTPDIGLLLQGVVQAGTEMLSSALRMAAPIMAASFILMIVLAIASKVLPEMDILFISLPFKIGLGLLLLSLFLPYLDSYVWEFAKMLNKLLPT